MKKISYLVSLFLMGALTSCQQDEILGGEGEMAVVPVRTIDLQDLAYADVAAIFNGNGTVDNIRFTDGELTKDVKKISINEAVDMVGDESAEATAFYVGAVQDSIDVIVNKEYASVRMTVEGNEYGYVSFADPSQTVAALAGFEADMPATRAANTILTRGTSNPSFFKINLTEAAKHAPKMVDSSCGGYLAPEADSDDSAPVGTRAAYYTQWPRGNTLTIHLVRDAGNMPWEHEVNWQVNDMVNSLRDIHPGLNVKVWRSSTGYRATARYDALLAHFRNYCLGSSFPYPEASGRDIVVLIRHDGYAGHFVGQGYVNSYKLSRYNNSYAFAISATTAWSPKTLAHEVGHILGAEHVAPQPWYLFWLRDDVMAPVNNTINLGWKHLNYNNRNRVWNNLH